MIFTKLSAFADARLLLSNRHAARQGFSVPPIANEFQLNQHDLGTQLRNVQSNTGW